MGIFSIRWVSMSQSRMWLALSTPILGSNLAINDSKFIVTNTGGRQGCKLGALLFNLVYSIALRRVRDTLVSAGIIVHLRAQNPCFWTGSSSEVSFAPALGTLPLVEITYDDDEAVTLSASSPAALRRACTTLISTLTAVFRSLGLVVNWKPGKTEAFMVFRGKNAGNERRKLVNEEHCKISLPADAGANSLRIVRQYVHRARYVRARICSRGKMPPPLPHPSS